MKTLSRHFHFLTLASCAALTFGDAQSALAEIAITPESPFAACTADNVAAQPGTAFINAEVEPWISANPKNPRNLVAGWQQDRWSNGGSRGLVAGYSRDGGLFWNISVPQGTTLCAGGPFERASDPWTTIAKDGTAYFMTLAFNNDEECADGNIASGDNAMIVHRSTDGGATWGAPINMVLDTDGQKFNDKNAMLADPYDKRFVYGVWDKLIDFTFVSECPVSVAAKAGAKVATSSKVKTKRKKIGHRDGVLEARERLFAKRHSAKKSIAGLAKKKRVATDPPLGQPSATPENSEYTGPTYFVRSVNGGQSWRPERMIFDPGPDAQTINNLIEVLPNGDVLVLFTHILVDGSIKLGIVRSKDKGAHWSKVSHAFDINATDLGTVLPNEDGLTDDQQDIELSEVVRDAAILFDTAVDPKNGNIYIVWQDGRDGGIDRVAFSQSRNGGRSWSAPVFINQTPTNANPLREQAFVPSVEVGKDGRVFVTHYDFRFDTDAPGQETAAYWGISCDPHEGDNCADRSGWGGEQQLSTRPFNMADAPVARGHFLGDYQGLVRAGKTVKALFGQAIAKNVNDMFITDLGR